MWMPDENEAFVPARIVQKLFDGSLQLETEDGISHTLRKQQAATLEPLIWSSLRRITHDLVLLDAMNQPLILYTLKERFKKSEIYTNIGTILVRSVCFRRTEGLGQKSKR